MIYFFQVTHAHFWLKRQEIEKQCEEWIAEMEKQVESDPNGSRAVAVGLTALKVNNNLPIMIWLIAHIIVFFFQF